MIVRSWCLHSEYFYFLLVSQLLLNLEVCDGLGLCYVGESGPLVILPKGRLNNKNYIMVMEETMMDFWMEQSEERGYVVV